MDNSKIMTNPIDAKAREIADKLSDDFEKIHGMRLGWVTDRFAAALREQYERGIRERETYFSKELEKEYKRGIEEAAKVCDVDAEDKFLSHDEKHRAWKLALHIRALAEENGNGK